MKGLRGSEDSYLALHFSPFTAYFARPWLAGLGPRLYQMTVLGGLLAYGLVELDFDVSLPQVLIVLISALGAQYAGTRIWGLPAFDPRSALISSLSLCLLLRTNALPVAAVAAYLAIWSKFALRWRGKHVFNPTNLALVVVLGSGLGWVSPGQWGREAFLWFLVACLGGLVVNRAARSDVTYAFLASYVILVLGRATWLGDPLEIPLHHLQNGALLIFAFFMISDPKTTPDSRAGRIAFAVMVAGGAAFVEFVLYRPNGLLWALACGALTVPLLDRFLPGPRYAWSRSAPAASGLAPSPPPLGRAAPAPHLALPPTNRQQKEDAMIRTTVCSAVVLAALGWNGAAFGFCGFYVAKADTRLYNKASEVAIVRHDDKTVITMANDFRGDVKEFATVVPVPTVLERGQIHIADHALLAHLDAYSAPRLVEYFDPNPCEGRVLEEMAGDRALKRATPAPAAPPGALGVTVEAQYTVGEYDILILSARESHGLDRWLRENGYRVPDGASRILGSYLKQDMKFFVAKVNLHEHARLGYASLRPIQVAYASSKFMLPIRLGTLNADGMQELFIYTITRKGRVETTNYRTVRLPSALELPVYVKDRFGDFYRDLFTRQVRREDTRGVFLEYAWDMNWCDPCAADPLSVEELRQLGVFWLEDRGRRPSTLARDAFLTRLHVRYDAQHFPQDLFFHETTDRGNFQARYILRHPWTGAEECPAAARYREQLRTRYERQAQTLAHLTGWDLNDIRRAMGLSGRPTQGREPTWWEKLWGD